ncbi:MAG: SDR family oxidoreductase [Anaerolineales bacterium]|nr:SDR family oxidoreductase [Anaerolineales bacterium]MCW5855384.1 SDR family oxidoreductase [Anaerolineales bacterium]
MTRILVTGVSGLLGSNLALAAAPRYEVVGVVHRQGLHNPGFETVQADLLDLDGLGPLLDAVQPDWVVNCAALANLNQAEQQPQLARRLNTEMPGRLAAEAAARGLRLVHISTDAVFDGSKGNYRETDGPKPLSVYAQSKRMAELAVKSAHPGAILARTVFFGWSVNGQQSLAEFFYNNLSAGQSVQGHTDRRFCPLLVTDLAELLLEMLDKDLNGIYHVASADSITKYEFGLALAERFGLDPSSIEPAESTAHNPAAKRSPDLSLNTSRLVGALGRRPPSIARGIEGLHAQLENGHRLRLRAMAESQPQEG